MIRQSTLFFLSMVCLATTILAAAANAQQVKPPVSAAPAKPAAAAMPHIPPATVPQAAYDRARTIARVEAYLSNLKTVKAGFNQVAPNGEVSTGTFYLKRPGKMRWDYNPPNPILLVSDGDTVTYYDEDLEQINYIALDDTLAGFLTKSVIRFDSDAVAMREFHAGAGAIRVTVVQRAKPDEGALTLEFSDAPLTLKHMVISDATGGMTRVQLQNAQYGIALEDSLFRFKDPRGVKLRRK
jgi:outer membrane lipoprotein-sorting protein